MYAASTAEDALTAAPTELLRLGNAEVFTAIGVGGARDPAVYPLALKNLCFSTAVVDVAGNLSPRSDALCIETTNPDDPNVDAKEGSGCSIARGGPSATAVAFTALCVLGLRRGRGRTPARR